MRLSISLAAYIVLSGGTGVTGVTAGVLVLFGCYHEVEPGGTDDAAVPPVPPPSSPLTLLNPLQFHR